MTAIRGGALEGASESLGRWTSPFTLRIRTVGRIDLQFLEVVLPRSEAVKGTFYNVPDGLGPDGVTERIGEDLRSPGPQRELLSPLGADPSLLLFRQLECSRQQGKFILKYIGGVSIGGKISMMLTPSSEK